MSTLLISILSGLFGASITAYFSYRIRLSLMKKGKKEEEHRLAYVYVSQLSQYPAIQTWVNNYLKAAQEKLDSPIPNDGFEISHAAAVYIEDVLSNIDENIFEKMESIDKLIDIIMDNFKSTSLSQEQLAKLPKKTLIFYLRYEYHLKAVFAAFQVFKVSLSNKDLIKIINAKQINTFIESVKSLFKAAGLLRAAMIEYGGINSVEATNILERQYEFFRESILSDISQTDKLDKAKQYLIEHGEINANKSSQQDASKAGASA